MSKQNAAPIDPETEVTREDIAIMADCSVFKVGFVSMRDKWGFPKPVRKGVKGKILYSRAEVSAWLENNDLKTFVFLAEDRAPLVTHKAEIKQISSAEFARLPIGTRPRKKFTAFGTSVRVHVQEQHGYVKPHSALARASHNTEHRLSGVFF